MFYNYCIGERKSTYTKVWVTQLCPTLCDPMDCSLPGSSVHGIFQARILEWVDIPFTRGSSWPRDWTWFSCIAGRFFTVWTIREAHGEKIEKIKLNILEDVSCLTLEWSHGCHTVFTANWGCLFDNQMYYVPAALPSKAVTRRCAKRSWEQAGDPNPTAETSGRSVQAIRNYCLSPGFQKKELNKAT